MQTGRLIDALAADAARKPQAMAGAWLLALLAAVAFAAAVFFATLGPRPDFAIAAETPRFLFKFVVTLVLLASALAGLIAIARPGARLVRTWLLVAAPLLLAAAVIGELVVLPSELRATRWMGTNALLCMVFIPVIGLGPLAAFLLGLRHGAPTRPALAGAMAGISAGALAATFYAAHCVDDSPLFVATWYTLAIAALALIGALGGRYMLRW
ncbi:MAG: NrsF family protein [Rhizobiaceae bacterium]